LAANLTLIVKKKKMGIDLSQLNIQYQSIRIHLNDSNIDQ